MTIEPSFEQSEGFSLCFYESLPSTQVTSRQRIEDGLAHDGDVIITAEQTAGYGRRGRAWYHQPGNVYLTLTRFFDDKNKHLLGFYGFVTSLAIGAACRHYLAETDISVVLKWPNDVLVDNGKIAGILLERMEKDDQTILLLGTGINLVPPQDVDQSVSGLNNWLAKHLQPHDFILVFLRFFSQYEEQLHQHGFPALRQSWLSHAKGQGDKITARLANGTILTGIFLDLDHHGALLLQMDDETVKTITAADIFFTA
jgi:BirA family transcriptional regulator, biotin operon repressor / biotin---[acetyl-CoA-carboxylase] ligase